MSDVWAYIAGGDVGPEPEHSIYLLVVFILQFIVFITFEDVFLSESL